MPLEVELPDGTLLEAPDGADPSVVAKAYLAKRASPQNDRNAGLPSLQSPNDRPTPEPSMIQEAGKYLADYGRSILGATRSLGLAAASRPLEQAGGALEAALAMGTGLVAPISAGMGRMSQGQRPGDFTDEEAARFTYQPRTQTGRELLNLLGTATQPLSDSGADVALLPLAAESSALRPPTLSRAPASVPAAVSEARALGLKLDPRQVIEGQKVGSLPRQAAAVVGGKAAIPADASILNQAVTRRLVAEDLGLPSNESITQATIDRLSSDASKAYTDLKGLRNAAGTSSFKIDLANDSQYAQDLAGIRQKSTSTVTGQMDAPIQTLLDKYETPMRGSGIGGVVDDIAELRFDARKHFKSDDPAIAKQARAERQLADALEGAVDRQVSRVAPELVENWRASRVKLAKLHAVEDALVGTEIDARLLAKAEDSGAKLSGNMKRLASAARNFPTVMQAGANLGSKSGLGLFDVGAAGVGGTLGALIGGVPGALIGMATEPAVRLGSKRIALGPGYGVRQPPPLVPPDSSFIARYILGGDLALRPPDQSRLDLKPYESLALPSPKQ